MIDSVSVYYEERTEIKFKVNVISAINMSRNNEYFCFARLPTFRGYENVAL